MDFFFFFLLLFLDAALDLKKKKNVSVMFVMPVSRMCCICRRMLFVQKVAILDL